MKSEYYSTRAEISLKRLVDNYKIIKSLAGGTEVLCVIKADAYGHGAKHCAAALKEAGASFFGAANIAEAVEIREAVGEYGDILILGHTPPQAANDLVGYNITQNVFSLDYAKALSAVLTRPLKAHLKIDTGMNRLGISDPDTAEAVFRTHNLNFTGIFTHFACADEPDKSMTDEQFKKFAMIAQELERRGISFGIRHASASTGIINYPGMRLDMVRGGIILYGLEPSSGMPSVRDRFGLKPVMSLKTKVTYVHKVNAGETISYGASYTAEHDMTVATLPIGYADGFIRAYAKGGTVVINGNTVPIVGRICMDQCMTDVTGLDVKEGDDATVFGDEHPVEIFSELAGTISYETVCLVGKRVPRFYQ